VLHFKLRSILGRGFLHKRFEVSLSAKNRSLVSGEDILSEIFVEIIIKVVFPFPFVSF